MSNILFACARESMNEARQRGEFRSECYFRCLELD
jgi:hypothetical protein